MLQFADEVVVVDTSDGRDDTYIKLLALQAVDERIKVIRADKFDWSAPNHGIFDGQTKALARAACKGDFLWQFDVDEIVHELDAPKVRLLVNDMMTKQMASPIVALPVVEYWGSQGKVRADINPWKARLSRNLLDITHGIPKHLRRTINGLPYASPGTDTCDYISKSSGLALPVMGFMDQFSEMTRQTCLRNSRLVPTYEKFFNQKVNELPGVFHYSWFSIERKIKQYRLFWTDFWKAMYGPVEAQNRDPNWNPFFEVPWEQVTDEMITAKAKELEEKTGGWIFHNRWDGSQTPHVTIHRDHPALIKEWVKKHG